MAFRDVIKPTVFKLFLVCLMLAGMVAYLYKLLIDTLRSTMIAQQTVIPGAGGIGLMFRVSPSSMNIILNIGYFAVIVLLFYIVALIIEQAYLKIFKE